MSRGLIAVDIDEVLFPFVREFALHHNDKYQTTLTQDDFFSYHFDEVIGITLDEAVARVYRFLEVDRQTIEPLSDAKAGLHRISMHYDIAVLTARHPKFQVQTERWLKQHFPVDFHSITMIGYERAAGVPPKTKAEVCVEIGAKILVDDSLKYVLDAARAGIRGVLFGDYPWNQTERLPVNVRRVQGWGELAEYLHV